MTDFFGNGVFFSRPDIDPGEQNLMTNGNWAVVSAEITSMQLICSALSVFNKMS
jgi:hypothetical protein